MTIFLSITLVTQVIIASNVTASKEGCVTLEGFGRSIAIAGLCYYTIPVDLIDGRMIPIKRLTVESGGEAEAYIRQQVKNSGLLDYSQIQRVLIHQKSGEIMLQFINSSYLAVGSFNQRIDL